MTYIWWAIEINDGSGWELVGTNPRIVNMPEIYINREMCRREIREWRAIKGIKAPAKMRPAKVEIKRAPHA